MIDTRFTTVFGDVDELLAMVDVDVDDLETQLIFLLERPIAVEAVIAPDGEDAFEVIVCSNEGDITACLAFPMSMLDLARACAEVAAELGPYLADGRPTNAVDVQALDDDGLIEALRLALGKVRITNMMDAKGEFD